MTHDHGCLLEGVQYRGSSGKQFQEAVRDMSVTILIRAEPSSG